MRVRLTEKFLASLTLKEGSHPDVNDTVLRGLQIRKSKRGISGYAVGRLRGGRPAPIRLLIGKYPDMSLAELRAGADKLLRDLRTGIHPRQREAEQRRAKAAQQANTLGAVAHEFIKRHAAQKRTGRWIERRIERELISRWGDWPISQVTRRDVVTMVDEIVDRGHPEAARQTLAYGRRLFSWAIARGVYGIEHSPFDRARGGDLIGPKKLRQRVPSDRELALIWSASFDISRGDYVQLLQLLGMRRCELSEAVWSEFDLDRAMWTIPADRMKSNETHVIPLAPVVIEILRALPRLGRYVFSARGDRPISDFTLMKQRLNSRIATLNGGQAIPAWTFHDLRRSFRTGLSTLGIAPHIAELCLAHRQRGLARVYDLHRFDREKRLAFEAWAAHLVSLVELSRSKVVPADRQCHNR